MNEQWTTKELLTLFRKTTNDETAPYLWSDQEFCAYLDEAQTEFITRVGGIRDTWSEEATQIETFAAQEWIPLHMAVYAVDVATFDGKAVQLCSTEKREPTCAEHSLYTGRDGFLKWLSPPKAGMLSLSVRRTALWAITSVDTDLEVHRDHRLRVMSYVYAEAYRKQDAETYDRNVVERHLQDFERYVAKCGNDAVRLRLRLV